jgi:hypothetical protein
MAQTGISGGEEALAYLIFAVVATIGVAAPVVIYLAMGDRAPQTLGRIRDWMSHNNAVIMSILCLIIGTTALPRSLTGGVG